MYKIQTLNNIAPQGLDLLKERGYEIHNEFANPDGILVRSFNMKEFPVPTSLKAVARAGAGVNNIPVDELTPKGIVVFNTPGGNANAVKELVLASLFMSSRNLVTGIEWTKSLKGESSISTLVESKKKEFAGVEISGKKLGIIGLGAIGALVANDALALNMDVLGYDPFVSVETAWRLSREVERATSLEQIFSTCDYITLHVPLTPDTKCLIDDSIFSVTKKGARLFNFSRGELVCEDSLERALKDGTIATYVTDFPNARVLELENVIPIPHLGASTSESEENCAQMAARQLKDYLETGNITNSVNYPNVKLPYIGKTRITVAHQNIPNMVGQITGILAKYEANIADMLNKSKGPWAYTMIDIDNGLSEEVKGQLEGISGVVAVRII